jgi:hypothetical protein
MVLKLKEPLRHSPMREPLPFNACFCALALNPQTRHSVEYALVSFV